MKSDLVNGLAGASTAAALLVRNALRIPLSEDLARRALIVSLPWLPWLILALVLGGSLGWGAGRWLSRLGARNVLRPLLIPGLAALAYLPGALSVAPVLAVFSGPFQDLLLLGCLSASLWRLAEHLGVDLSPTANRVALVAFVLYLALGYRLQEKVGLSGDEPHYLLICYSLLHDGDLAVEDNYRDGDFRSFYQGRIRPHLVWGLPYSVHGVGLPLLLLPGFALLGLRGVLLTEALMGALLAREVFRAAEILSGDRSSALAAAASCSVTSPALFQCISAYPELPAAVVAAWSFRRTLSPNPPLARGSLLWGLSLGLLPLLHVKFLSLAAVLGLGAWIRWPTRRWMIFAGMAWGALSVFLFFAVILEPNVMLLELRRQHVFLRLIPVGLAGLLFDRAFGLLPASPFYIVAIAGIGRLLRHQVFSGLFLLAIFASLALPAAAHPAWWAGSSPSARYIFPALPVVAMAAAGLWAAETRQKVRWSRTLLLISLCLGTYMALGPGQPLYLNPRDSSGRLWESLGTSWDLTHYLPSILQLDSRSLVLVIVGSILLLVVISVQASSRRFRLPSPWLVLLAGAWLIDLLLPGRAPDSSRAQWMRELLRGLAGRQQERFLVLPTGRSIAYPDAVAMVDLPLDLKSPPVREAEESLSWESPPLFLPAGQYRFSGDFQGGLSLLNGEGLFSRIEMGDRFATRLDLAHFQVRASARVSNLRITPTRIDPSGVASAERSLLLASGVRLHSLDDNAFLDPKGFWVEAGALARFALEGRGLVVLSVANGAQENAVEVAHGDQRLRFALRPWAAKRLTLPLAQGTQLLTIKSSSGFRPTDIDPARKDRRLLGVFVTSPGNGHFSY